MLCAPNSSPETVYSPEQRVQRLVDLLGGEFTKSWTLRDQNVRISATTGGYEIQMHGMRIAGNDKHYYFSVDHSGNLDRAEAKVQMGCLIRDLGTAPASHLDGVLRAL